MQFIGTYLAKPDARHPGDFILQLHSGSTVHNVDAAEVPRGTPVREAAEAWCARNGHTLKIDWSSLSKDHP